MEHTFLLARIMEDSRAEPGVFEFRTLGGVTLTIGSEPRRRSLRLPPKPLALLAYLAIECPHGHRRRDDLVGLLWPELPDQRARAGLSQALYLLKQDLGPRALLAHGQDVVCVNPEALWCDAEAFTSAVDEGRSRDALDLYRGPFLRGFHLSDAGDFEHWVFQARRRFHERAAAAAKDLARDTEAAGDLDEALRFATRALELNPYDETALRHLIRVFDNRGERALALDAYERFAARLRDEVELEPSPETTQLVKRVKLRRAGNGPAPETGKGVITPDAPGRALDLRALEPRERGQTEGRRPWWKRLWVTVATPAVLTMVALGFWSRASTPLSPDRVLVGGVARQTGDPTLDGIAAAMADRVVRSLSLLDDVTPVLGTSPGPVRGESGLDGNGSRAATLMRVARNAGAATLVFGYLDPVGDSLRMRFQVVDVADGVILHGIEEKVESTSSVEAALRNLSFEVAWAVGRRTDPRLEGWERMEERKPRFDAYLQFMEGVEVYLGSAGFRQPEGAVEYFERATRLDSTFYAPRVWSVIAHSYMGNAGLADSLAVELQGISDRFSLTERYVLESWIASRKGRTHRALSLIRGAMILSPEGEYLPLAALAALDAERPQEAVRWMTKADTARGWAAYWGAYSMSLAEGYHQLGMHELELEPARRAAREAPANIYLQIPEVRALAELGSPELEKRLEEILARPDPPYTRGEALCLAATESLGHHPKTGVGLLGRCIRWDTEHLALGGDATRLRLGQSLLIAGRLAEARTHLEGLAETRADNPHVMGPLGVLEALDGNAEEAERIIAHLDELDPPVPAWKERKVYWQAAIVAHLGQPQEAIGLLAQLAETGGGSPDPRDPFLEPLWDHPLFGQLVEVTG